MSAIDLTHFVRRRDDSTAEIVLAVEPLGRGVSLERIEQAVRDLAPAVSARLNLSTLRLTVRWREGELAPGRILDALSGAECRGHPIETAPPEAEEARQARWLLSCLAVAGFAAMNIMLLSVSVWAGNVSDITPETRDFFHWLSALIAIPTAAYAGQPFFRSAMAGLRSGRMNMDVPISLGILLALGMSVVETARHAEHAYFDSAVMLLFFLLCGRTLDHAMRRRTRAVAGNLAALKAPTACRLDGGDHPTTVPIEALRPGDRVLVRPGERCPADGVVLTGRSSIDEGLVTGETEGRDVMTGDMVHGGALNRDGALVLRVTAAGEDALLAEVERLVARAGEARSTYVRLADRAARLYAPVVHATALLTTIGWLAAGVSLHDALIIAISVLIITCPCALALAVPAVQTVAAGALFRSGVLLNSPLAIEKLSDIDTVFFDKTGTLTLPEPQIANCDAVPNDLLVLAGRLAQSSRHPLAIAVASSAADRRPLAGAVESVGEGVAAMVDGEPARLGSPAFCEVRPPDGAAGASYIAIRHGDRSAVLRLNQSLRPDAAECVGRLAAMGKSLGILSGDRPGPVAAAAAAVGVENWKAALRPAEKVAILDEARRRGRLALMVGDGLNDAPALAAAHVSMSPVTGADVAHAQADALFIGNRLSPVADAVAIAVAARRLMRQNLWIAVVYNAIALPLAVAGMVTPLIAAAAMSGSSVIVTVNALRARAAPREEARDTP